MRYKRGIRCGLCESPEVSVVLTRHGNQHTIRTRKCKKCHHRFRTIEINERYITSDAKFDFMFITEKHNAPNNRPSSKR